MPSRAVRWARRSLPSKRRLLPSEQEDAAGAGHRELWSLPCGGSKAPWYHATVTQRWELRTRSPYTGEMLNVKRKNGDLI
jgi:hypothetical protein